MKNSGKSTKPIIAAHSTDIGTNPAKPGNGKPTGAKARGSRVSRASGSDMRTQVLERISDGILAFDAEMHLVYVDARAGELLGREAQELVGKSFAEAYPESTSAPFADACRRAFASQTVIPFDGYFPSSNTWFEGRVYPSSDGLSVLISDRGLPEQEEILRTLEESEEKFSKAFHSSPIAKLIIRLRDGVVVDVNYKFLSLFRIESDHELGSVTNEPDGTTLPEWKRTFAEIVQQPGNLHEQEFAIHSHSGEPCYLLISSERLEIEHEACVLIACVDVTERKQVEDKAREISEFPLQNPNPVMRLRQDGTLLYANPASDPLLDSWKDPAGKIVLPSELRELLPAVVEAGAEQELELEHQEKIYTCLLVPVLGADYVNLYFSDVTIRKQTQESLQALIHQTTTGITRSDLEGRFVFVNQAFCDMLGYSEAELLGKLIWDINHPEDAAKNKRLFEKMIEDGEPYQLEKRIVKRNGAILWVSVENSPLRDANGKTYATVSMVVDITRRKRAEESLMDNARRTLYLSTLSDILRPLSDTDEIEREAARLVCAQLKASRVAYANIAADETATVYNCYTDVDTELIDKFNIRDYIPTDILPRFRVGRAFVTSGKSDAFEKSETSSAAEERAQALAQIVIPLIRDNELVAALFVQDLQPREWRNEEIYLVEETAERMQTAIERARAEAEQRKSELRFRILSDTVPSMVWSTAPDGTIEYLNQYWHDYTGLTTEQTISDWAQLTLHPDDYERYTALWKQTLASTPDEYIDEARYRRNDGEYRWFQSRAIPVRDERGNVTAWYGVTTDIHDRMEKQAELVKIINNTPFMMTRCSRDLRYQFISRTYAEMIGRTPEEVAGKPIVEIMGEEGLKTILPYVERVLQGERVEYEAEIPFEGIGTPTLHEIYAPDYDEQGNVIGWFASIMDVTARKLAEREKQQMLEREQTLRAEAEKSKVEAEQATAKAEQELSERKLAEAALGAWTDTPLPQDARPAWLRYGAALLAVAIAVLVRQIFDPMLGDSAQLITLAGAVTFTVWFGGVGPAIFSIIVGYLATFWFIMDPHYAIEMDAKRLMALLLFILSSGVVIALGNTMRRAQRHAHESARVAVERQRQAEFRLEMQRIAEDALRESERKFNLIYHKLPFVASLSRLDSGMLVDVNEEFERTFGYSRTEAIGKTSLDLEINPDAETRQRMLNELQQSGAVHDLEMELHTPAGPRIFLSNIDTVSLEGEKYILNTIQDITERKQAEDEIHRLNAELQSQLDEMQALMELLPIGVWVGNADCSIITGNPAAYEMMGLTPSINASLSPQQPETPSGLRLFVDGEEVQPDDAPMQRVARTGIPIYNLDHELLFSDGTKRSVIASVVPLFDQQGRVRKVIGAYTDFTEHRQMEQQVRASEEKYRRIVDTANEGIWEIGANARTTFVNPRMAEMLGYTVEEMLGRSPFDFLVKEDQTRGEDRMESAMRGVSGRSNEYRYYHKNGSVVWTLSSSSPQVDENGNFLGSTAMLMDITERKEIELALRESERKFSLIYNNLPFIASLSTLGDVRTLDVNDEFVKTLGYSREEAIGKTAVELGINQKPVAREEFFRNLEEEGSVHNLEVELVTKAGEKRIFLANLDIVTIDAEKYLLSTMVDITERKRIEQELAHERELLKRLFNTMPIMLSIQDRGVSRPQLNPHFDKLIGTEGNEETYLSVLETCYPDPEYRKHVAQSMLTMQEDEWMDVQMHTRYGTVLDTTWTNMHFADGTNVGVGIDITERKRDERALAEYARQQTALYQFSEQLQRVDSLEQIYNAALDTILDALYCDRASILISDEKGVMHFTAWRGLSDQYRQFTDGHSPWKPDAKNPTPIYYNDIESSDLSDELKTVIREEGICALAFIPLISNGKLIGKFMTYFNSPHTFSEPELDLSLTIARQFTFGIDRQRAEQNLRVSEDRLRLAVAAANIGIWDIDLRRHERAWSKEGKAIYGLAEDEYLDFERQLQLTHPDDRAYVDESVRAFRDTGATRQLNLEHRVVHPDGTVRWVEVLGEAVYEEEPLPIRLIGTIIDITERKKLEQQLEESNRKLSEILSSIQDDFYVINRDWKFVYASPLFTAKVNKEPWDFVGKSIWEMFPKHVGGTYEENLRAAMEQREVRRFEIGGQYTDAWYRMTAFPSEDGITVIGTDVTERKRAEDALRQSEERFAQFMQYLPGLAWIKDTNGRYVFVNDAAEKAFNTPREKLYGKTDMQVFAPEIAIQYKKNDEQALREGKGVQVVETLQQDDGILHYSLVTKFPIPAPDGRSAMIGGTAFDITERKRAEDALLENQAMLQSFYDSAPFLMGIAELDGNNIHTISGNRAVAEFFGIAAENLFGRDAAEAGSTNLIEIERLWVASYRRSQKSGKPVHFEYQHPRGSGQAWLSVAVAFIGLGPTGKPHFSFVAEDVTERKRIEEALRIENERFMRFVDSNIVGIVIGDADGKLLLVNDYYLNLLGVTRQDFLANKVDWKKFTPPEWLAADEKAIEELRQRGICEPYEKEYVRTDGERVPVFIANALLPGPGEEIAAFILDMTERKRAENRLALLAEISEATRRFDDPVDLMASVAEDVGRHFQAKRCLFNEIDLENDLETVHRDYHEGLESVEGRHKLTDYSSVTTREMVAGKTVVNYDAKTDPRTRADYERSYLPTGERSYVAIPLMRESRWVASLWVSDDAPRQWSKEDVALLETIAERTWTATEKLRIDAALRESQQRLSLTYSHAAIGLVETSPDTYMLQCNDAFPKMLGYSREEIIGRSFMDVTYEEDARKESVLYQQLMSKQLPFYRIEKRFIKKDGSLTWCEMVRSVVLDGTGKPRFGIGAVFDINERKQREEALRARTEEVETLMEVSPIGIMVAHDRECNQITGNPAAHSLLGFPLDSTENLSKPRLDELKPSQSHRVFRNGVELTGDELPMQMSARLGIEIEEQELELRFEDGTQKYIYFYTKPLFDHNGATRGTVASMLDITERRRNEEALKAARKKAEETASRIARLQEITAALSAQLTPAQVPEVVIKQGVPALGATVGTMMEASPDGQALAIRYSTVAAPFIEAFKYTAVTLKTPATDAFTSGKAVWIESRENYLERYPQLAEQIQRWNYQAALSIPMEYKGHIVGVLNLSFDSITPYNREDEEFALTLARQGAQALERAQAEESLRASEERYRAIINQTTVGIVRKDLDGNILYVNQAFYEMVGYSSTELIDKSMWDLTYPDDVEKNRRLYNEMITDKLPFRIEKRLLHRDGSIIWVLVSVSPLLDTEGKVQSAVSVYSDITLRKYAESELQILNLQLEERVRLRTAQLQAANTSLKESEATARLIIESMPDAIVIINKEGQVVYCNAQVETLFGYKPNETLGQPFSLLIPERYQQALGHEREVFGHRKDQSQFPADILVSSISSRTNWDRIITIRDTTEQRLAQEAIRKNEEKLRSLFEVLPVGISFLDHEGNITEMNSTLTQILELSKSELAEGRFKPRRYIRADGSPMPEKEIASSLARVTQRPVYNVVTGIVKENGHTVWTSVNAAPVDIGDVDVVVATIDITDRKKVEDELHRSRERLRILSRRLVEVQEEERHAIARELHDRVGQNLAALNLNLNILRSQLSAEALQVIGTRLSDSVSLVNQILGITRNVMADLRSDVLDEYGLESALREFADQFTQRTGIHVDSGKSTTSIPRLDPGIEMTLLRIAQEALTNVARHAKANRATVTLNADEEAIYMSIQDDGIGILSWQKANQPGSHGLRIIRERAEAFGGSVQVHSAYKKGTSIEVKIPLDGSLYKTPREKRS